jgi:aspartyl-tRNA(Asn)/glutamyl-tRNA(Gln) amidotransferase subunit A
VDDLARASALELREGFRAGSFSPVEVVDALAERIAEVEPQLKAFLTLTVDEARAAAGAAEAAYARGAARPLEGIPLAVKDLYDTAGIRTTYGSPMFAHHVPEADADAVRLAKEAGAIVIGKTSTHEFAWGISSYNAHFDSGRNPWDLTRVSGGSSGGSGAALAAFETPLALGSDTGGSIRVPAAFCGLVGFKPTFGLVPLGGAFPLAPSLDHAGPLARTPADAALLYGVLVRGELEVPRSLTGLRVAVSPNLMAPEPVAAIHDAFEASLEVLTGLGAELVEVTLPTSREILEVFGVLQPVQALQEHRARGLWPERREEYGDDVRSRLEGAEQLSFEDYVKATAARERIRGAFVSAFGDTDLIATPVSPVSPSLLAEEEVEYFGETKLFRRLVLSYTTPQDVVGAPACAVRAGFDELGIPVGVQLTGRPGDDVVVLGAAQALYDATPEVQARWPEGLEANSAAGGAEARARSG